MRVFLLAILAAAIFFMLFKNEPPMTYEACKERGMPELRCARLR
jgi:hypothetical protein